MSDEKFIKKFKGFSGSEVSLLRNKEKTFIRKIGNIDRNLERYAALKSHCNLPQIYNVDGDVIDMEYISGLDMKQFLKYKDINLLIDFLTSVFRNFSRLYLEKDYTEVYETKLKWIEKSDLPIKFSDLILKLPKILPQTLYHGDLTLENIIFSTEKKEFYLIDPLTSEYDSFVFDLAKLRQDLESKWFIRNEKKFFEVHLSNIQNKIFGNLGLPLNNYLLLLMLLRVYPYCTKNSYEHLFLKREIQRLWKY